MGATRRVTASGVLLAGLYLAVVVVMLIQQPGATTYDTRAELTERPGDFLSGAFTLWHPESNFGEFQNQAYGYLFPQGSWFALTDSLGMAGWVSQRLWSALLLIVACEGARRVARVVGLPPAPAVLAGVAFAASPRLLGTVVVQTGESLPGAVMPWLVLPVLLHLRGVLPGRRAVLLSGAAVVCMGGVNAVETAGSLPLAVILVVWGARRGLAGRRFVVEWFVAVGAACLWWALPLLVLARYAPPFFEYVESARDTTAVVGWSEATRGDSSWIGYLVVGDQPWWPAAYHLATDPVLVVVAAVVSGVGLAGLASLRSGVRRPLMLAAVVGLGALTVAHGGVAGSPVADAVRGLLDSDLQIFRNVHKIDPVVRLPVAVGFGCALWRVGEWLVERVPVRAEWDRLGYAVALVLVLVLGKPFLLNDARTPGWDEFDASWLQAQAYLAERGEDDGGGERALVVPGSGFAMQEWGWTLDEPLTVLGGVDMVSRSQVPLVPGQSIRYLSALDQLISTGRATEELVDQLARAGITHVVLRRDLLRQLTGSPHPGASAVSLARAGLDRVAGFGETSDGVAEVEVFEVPVRQPVLRTALVDDVTTVRGAPESVLGLEGAGLLGRGVPSVLEGEEGWQGTADVVTDSDQRRERAFGKNDEALSTVMTAGEPWRTDRAVHDYPALPGSPQVTARYDGLDSLLASSSQGYADNFGPVTVQSGPYAAVDGDLDSRWVTSLSTDPEEQWLRLTFDDPRRVREVTVIPVADDPRVAPIRTLEVVAGDQRVRASVNPSGAPAVVTLDGSEVDSVEIRVVEAAATGRARVGLREVTVDGLRPRRTLVLPGTVPSDAAWQLSTVPGRRACYVTLGRPDCDASRIRAAEELSGLDRTFSLDGPQLVHVRGHVVARSTPEAARLLDLIQRRAPVVATSTYGQDPKVAPRFAYDGQTTTSWVSDDADQYPTLTFRWRSPQTITGLTVASGGQHSPAGAVVTAGRRAQRVSLVGDAVAELRPVTTRELQVRFLKSPGSPHVVVPEIDLTGVDVTRLFTANAATGAVCGLGPVLRIDGRRVATRVRGTMSDIVNGSPLAFEACRPGSDDDRTVLLAAGEHRLRAVPTADFEVIDVTGVPYDADDRAPTSRRVEVLEWGSTTRRARVAAGADSVLYLPENFNAGWRAEADGEPLTPLRVDGWQQGWVLPAGGETTVDISYRPQRTYQVVLPFGLAVSGAVLVGGLASAGLVSVGAVRGRHRRRPRPRSWPRAEPVSRALWLAAVLASLLLLGPAVAAGLLAGSLGSVRLRPAVVGAGGAAAIALSGVLDAWGGASFLTSSADLAAGLGVGLLAGLVLGRPRRRSAPAAEVAHR